MHCSLAFLSVSNFFFTCQHFMPLRYYQLFGLFDYVKGEEEPWVRSYISKNKRGQLLVPLPVFIQPLPAKILSN